MMNLPNLEFPFSFSFPTYPSTVYLIPIGLVSFGILFILFLGLSIYFIRLLSQADYLDKEKNREYKEASEVLEEAKRQAFRIVEDANHKAEKILADANLMGSDMSSNINSKMEEIAEERKEFISESSDTLLKVNRKALLEASSHNLETLKQISGEYKKEMMNELKEFRKSLEIALESSRREVEEEMKRYKEAQRERIDQEVYEAVNKASKSIIGKSLNLKDHEEYIFKVLEEAKDSEVFKS